jgi:NCS1 family nucleobase:cation symporter-1
MGPAVSIMLVEYYLVSRGNIFVNSIYVGNSKNPNYWYYRGWNVQAYIAYIIAVGLCFIGFVNKVGATVPSVGVKIGNLGWFLSFTTGGLIYYLVNLVWPHPNVKNVKGLRWEQKASEDEYNGVDVLDDTAASSVETEAYTKTGVDDKTLVATTV